MVLKIILYIGASNYSHVMSHAQEMYKNYKKENYSNGNLLQSLLLLLLLLLLLSLLLWYIIIITTIVVVAVTAFIAVVIAVLDTALSTPSSSLLSSPSVCY